MTLTEKISVLMEEKGLNRKQLSEQCGIPYTTIVNFYKKGTDNVKLSTLKKLAKYFNVSLDYIADDSITEKTPEPEKPETEADIQARVKLLTDFFIRCGFIEPGGDISDSDLAFSEALICIIDFHFSK